MTNLYNGYVESNDATNARAWRIALQANKYAPNLNTEAEANALANLIDVVNTPVPDSSLSFVRIPFNDHSTEESLPVSERVAMAFGQSDFSRETELDEWLAEMDADWHQQVTELRNQGW